MATTVEQNVSNYKVDDATMDQFQNITTFVKNMVVKDSKLYDEAETQISRWFGSLLLKYVDKGLTEDEARQILNFVDLYNKKIDEMSPDIIFKLKCWGMYSGYKKKELEDGSFVFDYDTKETQDYNSSLLYLATLSLITLIPELVDYQNEVSAFIFKEFFLQYDKEQESSTPFFISEDSGEYEIWDDSSFSNEEKKFLSLNYINVNENIKQLINHNRLELQKGLEFRLKFSNGKEDTYLLKRLRTAQHNAGHDGNWLDYNDYILDDFALIRKDAIVYLEDGLVITDIDIDDTAYNYYGGVFKDKSLFEIDTSRCFLGRRFTLNIKPIVDGVEEIYRYSCNENDNYFYRVGLREGGNFTSGSQHGESVYSGGEIFTLSSNKKLINDSVNIELSYNNKSNMLDFITLNLFYEHIKNKESYPIDTSIFLSSFEINNKMYSFFNDGVYLSYSTNNIIKYTLDDDNALNEKTTQKNVLEYTYNNFNIFNDKTKNDIFNRVGSSDVYDIYCSNILKKETLPTFANETGSSFSEKIENAKETLIQKEKINISKTINVSFNKKLIASEEEKHLINTGDPLIFFDIVLDNNNYIILYKEFNREYRELLDSESIEMSVNNVTNISGDEVSITFSNIIALFNASSIITRINNNPTGYIRSMPETPILIKDFNINGKLLTTQLFKYAYSNSYLARKATESEIIKYYIGDTYISNGYGRFKYQIEEIYSFLDIYQNVRDYYYRVLLNESFINEEEYPLYEKLFISFWAIERFITNKVDNLKDIDSFDLTDIKNFLTSYGMSDLANIIDLNDFYSSEELSKNLIKKYVELVQNKGSRKVINVLEEAFSITSGTLSIYKPMLLNLKIDVTGVEGNKLYLRAKRGQTPGNKYFYFTNIDANDGTEYEKLRATEETSKYSVQFLIDPAILEVRDNSLYIPLPNEDNDFLVSNNFSTSGIDINRIYLRFEQNTTSNNEKAWSPSVSFGATKKDFPINASALFFKIDDYNNLYFATTGDDDNTSPVFLKLNYSLSSFTFLETLRSSTSSYNFIKIDYNRDNIYSEIINNIQEVSTLKSFTGDDIYWDESNTDNPILDNAGVFLETTKYLVPEFKVELSSNYTLTRCVFAIIDYFIERLVIDFPGEKNPLFDIIIKGSDLLSGDVNLYEYLKILRSVYLEYLSTTINNTHSALEEEKYLNNENIKTVFKLKDFYELSVLNKTREADYLRWLPNFLNADSVTSRYLNVNEETETVTLNIDNIKRDFSNPISLTGFDYQLELIQNIIKSLIPVYIFSYKRNDINTTKEELNVLRFKLIKKYLGISDMTMFDVNFVINILSQVIYLPSLIINGYNNVTLDELTWLDANGLNFINTLFTEMFIIDKTNPLLYKGTGDKTNASNYNEYASIDTISEMSDILVDVYANDTLKSSIGSHYSTVAVTVNETYAEKKASFIINACKELSEILLQVVQINISESETSLLNFLRGAIEYFISYTSQIYNISYIKEYDNRNENIKVIDDIEFMNTVYDIDSFFYDEKMSISLESK